VELFFVGIMYINILNMPKLHQRFGRKPVFDKSDKTDKKKKKKKTKQKQKQKQKQATSVHVHIDQSRRGIKDKDDTYSYRQPSIIYQQMPQQSSPVINMSYPEPNPRIYERTVNPIGQPDPQPIDFNTPLRAAPTEAFRRPSDASIYENRGFAEPEPEPAQEPEPDLYATAYPVEPTPDAGTRLDAKNPMVRAGQFIMTPKDLSDQIKK